MNRYNIKYEGCIHLEVKAHFRMQAIKIAMHYYKSQGLTIKGKPVVTQMGDK